MPRARGHFSTTVTLPVELIAEAEKLAESYRITLNSLVAILIHNDIERPGKLAKPTYSPSRYAYPKQSLSFSPSLRPLLEQRQRKTGINFSNYVGALLLRTLTAQPTSLVILRRDSL